jgi:hypothetical protein
MTRWPAHWPAAVAERYEVLSTQFGWPQSTVEGVVANVEYLRGLEEGDLPRVYLQGEIEGARWLWETVLADDDLVAVRQIDIAPDGSAHRYSWRQREDDAGFLTDQAIRPSAEIVPLPREEFLAAWG